MNCRFRIKNLLDESVVVESPRNTILNLIRRVSALAVIEGLPEVVQESEATGSDGEEAVRSVESLKKMSNLSEGGIKLKY